MREPSMANVVKSNTAEFHQGRGFHASSTVNLPIRPRRGNETVPFVFALFSHHWLPPFGFSGHNSPATRHSPLPPTTLPHCLLPATDHPIAKTRTGPISTNGLYIQYVTEPGDSCGKSIRYSLLATVGPLTILPWPEALNASRSKRACRMAIRRNACSLLALPDFPKFAQAVRYGVPGTPELLEIGRSGSSRRKGAAAHCTVASILTRSYAD